jgi:hypothetical protein
MPSVSGGVSVRLADGAPSLEALVNGVPTDIGAAYLQVDGQTVTSSFAYGSMSSFVRLTPGVHSLKALDTLGYFVGPLKTTALTAGNRYTLVVVGAYPAYSVLAFEEPKSASGTQLSFYEASPSAPSADFGRFQASSRSNFTKLGSAHFGDVATVALGKSVSNVGGYAGSVSAPLGALSLKQINAFDRRNVLPFHQAARLSLFLFDPKPGSTNGPVFGSLDR